MNDLINIFLISMSPIIELRGAIPVGLIVYELNPFLVFFISVLGNIIPVIFIILFLKKIYAFFSKNKRLKKGFDWFFERTRKKHNKTFEKYRDMGLVVLTAIPLPFTGAWTASVCAFLFGIPMKRAFYLISLGVIIAGIIVSIITLGII